MDLKFYFNAKRYELIFLVVFKNFRGNICYENTMYKFLRLFGTK